MNSAVEVLIRPAQRADAPAVLEGCRSTFDAHVARFPFAFEADSFQTFYFPMLQSYFEEPNEDYGSTVTVQVAECEGEFAGYVALGPAMGVGGGLHVIDLFVPDRFRRQGIATALLDWVKRCADENIFFQVEAVGWAFLDGREDLFKKAGFDLVSMNWRYGANAPPPPKKFNWNTWQPFEMFASPTFLWAVIALMSIALIAK